MTLTNTGSFDFETFDSKGIVEGRLATTPFMVCLRWFDAESIPRSHHCIDRVASVTSVEACIGVMLLNPDVKWYAHNMSGFDGLILLDYLISYNFHVVGTTSGSRIIELKFQIPGTKKYVAIRDTMNLVAGSLSHKNSDGKKCDKARCVGCIPCDFELPSVKQFSNDDYSRDMRRLPDHELLSGCFTDCSLVLELLDKVDELAVSWGGERKLTISGTAMSCLQASLTKQNMTIPVVPVDINMQAKHAYFGGRCEVLIHSPSKLYEEYDINSSYPASMCRVMPWEPCGIVMRLPTVGEEAICHATVEVPESMHIPPLPYRSPFGGLFFPTGTWQGWFAKPELDYAVSIGCVVHIDKSILYTQAMPFNDFVNAAYQVKSASTGAKRNFAKIIMNSAYGRFGMKADRETIHVFDSVESAQAEQLRRVKGVFINAGRMRPLNDSHRAFAISRTIHHKTTHYAIAAYITAYSRIRLHKLLMWASEPAYTDTDSVHDVMNSPLISHTGERLGAVKLVKSGYEAEFFAPKIYRLVTKDKTTTKAKGFRISTEESFAKLTTGEKIPEFRTQRLKTLIRKGEKFESLETEKAWHGHSVKRCPLPGPEGQTRPWTVDEINSGEYRQVQSPLL